MEGRQLVTHIILTISTALFLYQSGTALLKLNSGLTISVSEVIHVNDPRVKLPVITLCMTNRYPDEKNVSEGFFFENWAALDLYMIANRSERTFSFGKHLSLTYPQMLAKFNKPVTNFIGIFQDVKIGFKATFIQRYGFCIEVSQYQPTKLLALDFQDENKSKGLICL